MNSLIGREKHASVKKGDIVEITLEFNYLTILFYLFYLFNYLIVCLIIWVRLWYCISLRLFVYLFHSFFLFIYLFIYFCLFICYCNYCTKAITVKKSYSLWTGALSSPFVRSSSFFYSSLLFVCLFSHLLWLKNLLFSPSLSLSLLSVHFSFDCFFVCLFLISYLFIYLFISLLVWSLCKKDASAWDRTMDLAVNSRSLYQLSHRSL